MSEETKPDDITVSDWLMPEPIFRSTPGRDPRIVDQMGGLDEMTTQPGFSDQDEIDTLTPGFEEPSETPADDPANVTATAVKPKKSGCFRSFLTVVGLITLAVIGVVIALIYFLFYYRAANTGTF